MSERTFHRVVGTLKQEVRDSVSSYFSPVRAVVHDLSKAVHEATDHRHREPRPGRELRAPQRVSEKHFF